MTKDELLSRLRDIEWEDFEVKSASRELPKNIWESVSAFSNGSGGWIVFGVVQNGKRFEVEGVNNGEKIESDFLNTLRSGNKMNHPILPISKKYSIEGKTVLAFYIPSSPFKPVWFAIQITLPILLFLPFSLSFFAFSFFFQKFYDFFFHLLCAVILWKVFIHLRILKNHSAHIRLLDLV